MLYSISQYAEIKGVSKQAVYKQLSNHRKALEGHIIKENGRTWLDDEAVAFLNKQSQNSAPVIVMEQNYEDIEYIKSRKEFYKNKTLELQDKLIMEKEQRELLEAKAQEMKLLCEKAEQTEQKLEAEQDKTKVLELELESLRNEIKTAQDRADELELELEAEKSKGFLAKLFSRKKKG